MRKIEEVPKEFKEGKLDELITKGIISVLPQDPCGGKFYLDKDGSIKTTSELR